jgi:exodeoxyribonuclease V alpha subunit
MPEPGADPQSDFYLVRCHDPEDGVAKLLEIVAKRIPARFGLDPVRDVLVLCPMNRGRLGAQSLNLELQQLLNPPGEMRVERFGWIFGPGTLPVGGRRRDVGLLGDVARPCLGSEVGRVR